MLSIPEEIKNLFKEDNIRTETKRHLKLYFFDTDVELLFPEDTLYPSDELFPLDQEPCYVIDNTQIVTESMTITENLCSSDDLNFGECNGAQLEITVADVLVDLTGKECMLTMEVGGYEMAMGIYRVDSFVRQADRRMKKITAYNRMNNFQVDVAPWYMGLTFPMILKEFRDSLCAHLGIKQIDMVLPLDNLTISKTIEPEQIMGLDVLAAICEINGCFGQVDKTGRLKYVFLEKSSLFPAENLFPDEDLFPHQMSGGEMLSYYKQSETTYEDYLVNPIDKIQIRQEEGDVGAVSHEEGSNCYTIQGNFLVFGKSSEELDYIADTVYNQVCGLSYRPSKIVGPTLPWVEVGDGLICYTTDDVIETYCLKRTITGIQSMMDTVESKGTKTQKQNSSIKNTIIQLKGKSAFLVRSVDEVSATVSDLEKNTTSQIKVISDQISAEVKRATDQETELAGSIQVMAGEIEAKVSQGDLIATINMEVNKSGSVITMEAGHFIFKGDNFYVNEDGSGGAANGNLTWDTSGKVTAVGIELKGTANTSSIGCSVLSAQSANIDGLTVNGRCELRDVSTGDIYADDIQCTQIYSSQAGKWWSDRRMKHDINPITPQESLAVTLALKPMTFCMNGSDEKDMGFVAQDVATIASELPLYTMRNEYYALPYASYVALLSGAVQAQQEQIDKIKEAINVRQ